MTRSNPKLLPTKIRFDKSQLLIGSTLANQNIKQNAAKIRIASQHANTQCLKITQKCWHFSSIFVLSKLTCDFQTLIFEGPGMINITFFDFNVMHTRLVKVGFHVAIYCSNEWLRCRRRIGQTCPITCFNPEFVSKAFG